MVYILELEGGKFYVGHTTPTTFQERMRRHFGGKGAVWTRTHKPVKVVCVLESGDLRTERDETIRCMLRHGWENVRGSAWCQVEMLFPPDPIFSYYCPWFAPRPLPTYELEGKWAEA